MSGVLCVMIPGEIQMQLWCVNNWDIPLKVIKTAAYYNNYIDVLHGEMEVVGAWSQK